MGKKILIAQKELRRRVRRSKSYKQSMRFELAKDLNLNKDQINEALPLHFSPSEGFWFTVARMEDSHLENLVRFLRRVGKDSGPQFDRYMEELDERGIDVGDEFLCPKCRKACDDRELVLVGREELGDDGGSFGKSMLGVGYMMGFFAALKGRIIG